MGHGILTALTALVLGCGGTEGVSEAGSKPGTVETKPGTGSTEGETVGPTEETIVLELEGRRFLASRILECPATPGYGLGFNGSTEDYVGPTSDQGVRMGGGFEGDRGRVVVEYEGSGWTAGEGSTGGDLSFDLSDSRVVEGGSTHQLVTVHASGTLVDEAGNELPFDLLVTCEPGGT